MISPSVNNWPGQSPWALWQRLIFPFIFAYFLLFIQPWGFLYGIPGSNFFLQYFFEFKIWLVTSANDHVFQSYKVLVMPNGSTDTSFNWTEIKVNLVLSFIIGMAWNLLDRKSTDHNKAAYWLRIMLRFTIILNCLLYGIDKVFLNQMVFPSLSNLATPLGDLLPMRLSWLFIGYSAKYQFFLGIVEFIAGILLIFRRTSTLGTVFAAGIFANVVIMNLSYDIPVKIFSIHLFAMSLVLLAFEAKRLTDIFILNRPTVACDLYDVNFTKRWVRIATTLVKYAFVLSLLYDWIPWSYSQYKSKELPVEVRPVKSGFYDVTLFVLNKDTLPPLISDTLRWKDVVFEYGTGSVNTVDSIFWQRYRRGYFRYTTDTVNRFIHFTKRDWTQKTDSLFSLSYLMPDSTTILLQGKIRNDSIYAVLKRSKRHFQLAEKQFHWLSEYNR